jgi:hypothetical protein
VSIARQEQTTAREQSLYASSAACCRRESLSEGDCRRRNETQIAVSILTIRTIKERGMKMWCQLQGTSESLHHAQACGE